MYILTTATKKLMKLKKRIKGVSGGTSAGKTISIIQILIDKSQSDKTPKKTSIVSESFPHLFRGAEEDFKNIMKEHGYWESKRWNGTTHTYLFETGSRIEFFSADQPTKVRGPRRDRLFINEANNIPFEAFEQLEVRTRDEIWLDWNPTNEFWFYTEVKNSEEFKGAVDFIIINYKDNEGLETSIVESIERRKSRKGWWQVYGLGQLGEVEGKIYKDWQLINEIPHEARLISRGLDFGYSNDPTAIVDIYKYNDGYILDERMHQKGMSNKQIADFLLNLDEATTVADSAEPKSIDEIYGYGVNIIGAIKGQGSVNQGIQFVQDQKISITKRSLNLIKAYRNYMWKIDKNGKILNIPDHFLSDQMDAVRYGIGLLKPETTQEDPYFNQVGTYYIDE